MIRPLEITITESVEELEVRLRREMQASSFGKAADALLTQARTGEPPPGTNETAQS
jgi:hypothetical protein